MKPSSLRRLAVAIAMVAVVSMIASPASGAPSGDYDPAKLANITIANRLVADVFNAEDADAATALVSADAVIHTQTGDYTGPQGLLSYIASLKHTYPGAMFSIVRVTTAGDTVTLDWLLNSNRIRMATTGEVASVSVELRGSTAISTDEGQVADVTFDPGPAALPDTAAHMPGAGRPF